jgi:hypothetical protein
METLSDEVISVLNELELMFDLVYWRSGVDLIADVYEDKIEVCCGEYGEYDIPFSEWIKYLFDDELDFILFNIDLFEDGG